MKLKTQIILTMQSNAIKTAREILNMGGIVAFPTDTVYGLGSSAFDPTGIEKLFTAKGRDFNKAIAVLISNLSQLDLLTGDFNSSANKLATRFWPGALTLVVKKLPSLPDILSPTSTIGIRIPDNLFARDLISTTGPLATTSANLAGGKNPLTAQDVLEQLDRRIDLLIDGGKCPGGVPSTVVDCTQSKLVILRQGSISEDEIQKTLS
jgi:L-threonylcarbamoyladenylate synthase